MGVFAEAGMAEVYAWNGDSINWIDIIRSIPAIGWYFRFPLDVEFQEEATRVSINTSSTLEYICIACARYSDTIPILQMSIEY